MYLNFCKFEDEIIGLIETEWLTSLNSRDLLFHNNIAAEIGASLIQKKEEMFSINKSLIMVWNCIIRSSKEIFALISRSYHDQLSNIETALKVRNDRSRNNYCIFRPI